MRILLLIFAMGSPLLSFPSDASAQAVYDLVIRNGRVVDGTGAPWYAADVAIDGGRIVAIGRIAAGCGRKELDAAGLYVAPGFIDMMGQTATPMLDDPQSALNLLTQGITTINAGEGGSAAPLEQEARATRGWATMSEYFQLLDLHGLPVNVVQTIGHTQVRRQVLGDLDRRPSPEELMRMQQLVEEAMQAGAIGVSTALIYPPAVFAQTQEISALAQVAGRHGGRYYTHMRNEGDRLLEAIDEALQIGRDAKTPVHIFHLKAAGRQNWGKMQQAIARIQAARAAGEQVTADIYPYVNNGLGIAAFIHPRHFQQGRDALLRNLKQADVRAEIRHEMETTSGWENWFRHVGNDWRRVVIGQTAHPRYREHAGGSLQTIAEATGDDAWEVFFELVRSGAFALPESMTDANKILAMQQPFISFCTDVGPASGGDFASHPRAFGSFPRLLSRYVRDLGVLPLEQAVSQASAAAANDILAYDRGRLAEGLAADLILFDYEQLTDHATFAEPSAVSEGVKHVIVNGQIVLENGAYTGARPGRVLRGPGYDRTRSAERVATGELPGYLAPFDELMRRFIEEHHIPGAALAVAYKGRILATRGYGYARVASGEPVRPDSLFRIASISKPLTAIAILQLVEQGKLKLDDQFMDVLQLQPEADAEFDERLGRVTIEHLLQHRGGWDRAAAFDPMFRAVQFANEEDATPPASKEDIIQCMLRRPLDFDPGDRYAYSNFGYCLLGRVIEKISGLEYGAYVHQRVFQPLGIEGPRLGATRWNQRQAGEVEYYSAGVARSVFEEDLDEPTSAPYGAWCVEAMDSHGGWLSLRRPSSRPFGRVGLAGCLQDPLRREH